MVIIKCSHCHYEAIAPCGYYDSAEKYIEEHYKKCFVIEELAKKVVMLLEQKGIKNNYETKN